jgi:hypothetical protein
MWGKANIDRNTTMEPQMPAAKMKVPALLNLYIDDKRFARRGRNSSSPTTSIFGLMAKAKQITASKNIIGGTIL